MKRTWTILTLLVASKRLAHVLTDLFQLLAGVVISTTLTMFSPLTDVLPKEAAQQDLERYDLSRDERDRLDPRGGRVAPGPRPNSTLSRPFQSKVFRQSLATEIYPRATRKWPMIQDCALGRR